LQLLQSRAKQLEKANSPWEAALNESRKQLAQGKRKKKKITTGEKSRGTFCDGRGSFRRGRGGERLLVMKKVKALHRETEGGEGGWKQEIGLFKYQQIPYTKKEDN